MELDKNDAELWYLSYQIFILNNMPKKAELALRTAIKNETGSILVTYLFELAEYFIRNNDKVQAKYAFNRVLELKPDHNKSKIKLSELNKHSFSF